MVVHWATPDGKATAARAGRAAKPRPAFRAQAADGRDRAEPDEEGHEGPRYRRGRESPSGQGASPGRGQDLELHVPHAPGHETREHHHTGHPEDHGQDEEVPPAHLSAAPRHGAGEDARQGEEARQQRVLRGREPLLRQPEQQHAEGPLAEAARAKLEGLRAVHERTVDADFTPTCSAKHLPGFRDRAAAIQDKGVDAIACTAVNDGFVMVAWAKDQNIGDTITMLADGNGDFARAVGMELDRTQFNMGHRSRRYSMLVKNGVVEKLFVEDGGEFKVSSAEYLLEQLG